MIKLKQYQRDAVAEFERYLDKMREYAKDPHAHAFVDMWREKGVDRAYRHTGAGIDDAPYVCIKMPTGGGKTLVACHILNSLMKNHMPDRDRKGMVVWLVPTDAIKTQTLAALKNRRHPYRAALDEFFPDGVVVLDSVEARSVKRSDVHDNLCVIVATFGAFRVENRDSRKAYEQNGELLEHFRHAPGTGLILDEGGQPVESLVNVIRMNGPIIVIDEGHNAKTSLSRRMLADLKPRFLLEYTATPREGSNVLVDVSAQRLKEESMVKLPVELKNLSQWQRALQEGISKRALLEKAAAGELRITGEYVRPIALIQAEQEKASKDRIHVGQVRRHLTGTCRIPANQIAVRTGSTNDLRGVNLKSRRCPIRYIITVHALKEGWDEPFAYVLITVANVKARVYVEQTLGRILRLPNQQKKRTAELNRSYVCTSSEKFADALNALKTGLVLNGYSSREIMSPSDPKEDHVYGKAVEGQDISLACIAVTRPGLRRLSFDDDLMGKDFRLHEQEIGVVRFAVTGENMGITIDVAGDALTCYGQRTLDVAFQDTSFDEGRLVNWLDRNVRRAEYSQHDKRKYLSKFVKAQLDGGVPLHALINGRYTLRDLVADHIDGLESVWAERQFDRMARSGGLVMDKVFYTTGETFESHDVSDIAFQKHLFERAGSMNSEEADFARRLDRLENIVAWYRNVARRDFYIQGWRRARFYPDFVLKTKSGRLAVIEYKGEHLLSSPDTLYKGRLGRRWAQLAGDKYGFFMAGKRSAAEVLSKVAGM